MAAAVNNLTIELSRDPIAATGAYPHVRVAPSYYDEVRIFEERDIGSRVGPEGSYILIARQHSIAGFARCTS